jgi:hypothetical protein
VLVPHFWFSRVGHDEERRPVFLIGLALLFDAELGAWWLTQPSPEAHRQLSEGMEVMRSNPQAAARGENGKGFSRVPGEAEQGVVCDVRADAAGGVP